MLGALFAAMSVQWTVARAVGLGLVKDRLPFVRTAKGGWARKTTDFPAFWEAVLGALLIVSAAFLYATNWERVREIDFYALVLLVQSLPFAASVGFAALEASRANDFAFWRGVESKLATILPTRSATVSAAVNAIAEPQVAADNRVEPAQ
jgi:hypothetical protein